LPDPALAVCRIVTSLKSGRLLRSEQGGPTHFPQRVFRAVRLSSQFAAVRDQV